MNNCVECKRKYTDAKLTEFEDGELKKICSACLGIEWHKEWRYLEDDNGDLKTFTEAEEEQWRMRKNV